MALTDGNPNLALRFCEPSSTRVHAKGPASPGTLRNHHVVCRIDSTTKHGNRVARSAYDLALGPDDRGLLWQSAGRIGRVAS